MSISKRLFIFSLIPLLLSIVLIGFIIFQMNGIQKSSTDDVELLLEGKELSGVFLTTSQVLSNYAFNPSEANGEEIKTRLTNMGNNLKKIEQNLKTKEQRYWHKQISEKYKLMEPVVTTALTNKDALVIKREAARIDGVMNDLFMLQRSADEWYEGKNNKREKEIKNIITVTFFASIILIVSSLLSIWYLTSKTARPIRQLSEMATAVAHGDLTIKVSEDNRSDEIGQLTTAFKQMIDNLKITVQAVEEIGNKVQAFSTDLTREMNILTESSAQVATSTDELSQGSQSVSEEIQDIATKMELMNKNFEGNLENSKLSYNSSETTLESVKNGQQLIKEQREIMEKSNNSTKSIETSVHSFIDYTKEIELTAKLVNDIAEQTNLLALNAAIEAARAGEHGKGFAVVANEVRKLADESTSATRQIFSMVDQIHTGINDIEQATKQASLLSDEQTNSLNHTVEAFATIQDNVSIISNQLEQLTADMKVSNEMSSQIVASVQNISAVTEETAAGTEEISAAAEEQQHSFRNVQEQARQLEHMSHRLIEQLSRFKLV